MFFFQWNFPGLWVNFLVLLSHIPYKKSEELPLASLFEVFTGLWLSKSTFCKKVMIMLNILSVYWFQLVINTGCLEKFPKNGEHFIVDFQFNLW